MIVPLIDVALTGLRKSNSMQAIKNYIGKRKYEILLLNLLLLMFGNELLPAFLSPFLPLLAMIAGMIIFYKHKQTFILTLGLIIISIALGIISQISRFRDVNILKFSSIAFVLYFLVITWEVFRKIIVVGKVSSEIISAVICGFLMLCFLSFFLFHIIEVYHPGSFSCSVNGQINFNNLIYFSVSNQLTLGMGDIVPLSISAKKAVMFMGLAGHFYTVFVTGIIIGKYVNQMRSIE